MSTVGIIGGGLGGLAAAATLAARGHKVTLLEKNEWLGGKAAELEEGGFRFDMGPTILTMPRVLERVFAEAGRDMTDYLDLRRLDPQWRCFYDDGTVLDLRDDPAEAAREIGRLSPADEAGFQRFMEVADRLSDVSDRFFFWRSVEDIRDTMNLKQNMNLATLSDVMALRMHRTVAGQIKKDVRDPRVQQMLEHFIQYVGSSPLASPAVLCGIAQMQQGEGVWYPIGGTRAVPTALTRLGEELGVDYRTGVDVTGIDVEDGRAVGVVADGERMRFDKVVSNMDSVRTYRELVGGDAWRDFGYRKREAACSGIVLYLGLDRAYDHLAHHNFVFSRDPEEEFAAIYDQGVPAPDPTAYIAAPARTEPGVAPEGGEALYVLVHTPHLRDGHDWEAMLPGERAKIMSKLARAAGMEDLEERIVVERALTPQSIHDRYKVLDGAIYGLVSHGKVNGAFKPGNRSRQVRDLYLAGGSAHPGPGMPMALMSGWIAADSLDRDAAANAPAVAAE
ncbi:phytoene desaturase [Hasllibacter halocynthiae]|uniref:Phytoene desaturase n=1 Tax=Hasllibacter halocynthiae TaxID=595589 RepID=A0A2T0X2G4_9RHOB|nr:phytoene desaturase family protein [Hasllibacter halocynthiae]PRY93085.1 phytoene desaturase [Hasllibacter halocynthiae]